MNRYVQNQSSEIAVLFIVTTCNELYSLTLSVLHLNGYKLMVPRLSPDFYMASSHNILSLYSLRLCNIFGNLHKRINMINRLEKGSLKILDFINRQR